MLLDVVGLVFVEYVLGAKLAYHIAKAFHYKKRIRFGESIT